MAQYVHVVYTYEVQRCLHICYMIFSCVSNMDTCMHASI